MKKTMFYQNVSNDAQLCFTQVHETFIVSIIPTDIIVEMNINRDDCDCGCGGTTAHTPA